MKTYKVFLCEVCGQWLTQICSLRRHQKRNACKNFKNKNSSVKKLKKTLKRELNEHLIFKSNLDLESKSINTDKPDLQSNNEKHFGFDNWILEANSDQILLKPDLDELEFVDDLFPDLQSINENHFLFNESQVINFVEPSSIDNQILFSDIY